VFYSSFIKLNKIFRKNGKELFVKMENNRKKLVLFVLNLSKKRGENI